MRPKQQIFIAEYLKDFNATRAAKSAGYSEKTAYSIGQELLKKPEIVAAVSKIVSEHSMGKDEVLLRLADIARGNIGDLMDITPTNFSLELMRDGQVKPETKLIKKIKQRVTTFIAKKASDEDREVVETEIELYSALEALEFLAKLHGMLIEHSDVTSNGQTIEVTLKGKDES